MDTATLLKMLEPPKDCVDMVLDTDAFNEIDDQFAISYALRATDRVSLKALYAAPFFNPNSTGPADGMEKSYNEILKLLKFAGREDMLSCTFRGATEYLPNETTPVMSDAVADLVARARTYSSEQPLYVATIGAITNIASAILTAPDIIDKIVVVWMGGHAFHWDHTREFNMMQDYAAARVVFGSGVPLVQIPGMGVSSGFMTTKPELEYWFVGKNPLADYLGRNTIAAAESYASGKPWSRVIWDVVAIAYLVDRGGLLTTDIEHTPIPEYDGHYAFNKQRHFMRYVRHVNRDAVMADLIKTVVGTL